MSPSLLQKGIHAPPFNSNQDSFSSGQTGLDGLSLSTVSLTETTKNTSSSCTVIRSSETALPPHTRGRQTQGLVGKHTHTEKMESTPVRLVHGINSPPFLLRHTNTQEPQLSAPSSAKTNVQTGKTMEKTDGPPLSYSTSLMHSSFPPSSSSTPSSSNSLSSSSYAR